MICQYCFNTVQNHFNVLAGIKSDDVVEIGNTWNHLVLQNMFMVLCCILNQTPLRFATWRLCG